MIFTNINKFNRLHKIFALKQKKIANQFKKCASMLFERNLLHKGIFIISNYWTIKVFPHIQVEAKQVIEQLINQQFNQKVARTKVVEYLHFCQSAFKPNRTPLGCLAVLSAMHDSKNYAIMTYSSRIVDFLLNYQNLIQHIDQKMLLCYLKSHQDRQQQMIQKNKRSSMRHKFAITINNYFHLITNDRLLMFIKQIFQVMKAQRYNIISSMRYIQLFDKIQNRIQQILSEYFSKANSQRRREIQQIINSELLWRFSKLIKKFSFNNQNLPQLFLKFIIQSPVLNLSKNFIGQFSKIFVNLAYYYFPSERKTMRQILFAHLQKKCNQNGYIRKRYSTTFPIIRILNFYQYYADVICKNFQNFNYVEMGQFKVLYKSQFKRPEFNSFFWQQLSQYSSQAQLNGCVNFIHTLKQGYKDKVAHLTFNETNSIYQLRNLTMQNQMTMRAQKALKRLGEDYKIQINVGQRKVDFLLPAQKIIIEVDGDVHINFRNMEINTPTANRNMQFLIIGYRLIVINVHEYNMNRSVVLLMQLFKNKLKAIRQNDILYIQ